MSIGDWQSKAVAAYDAVQATIPQDWRLPASLLAPAWVYPEDFIVDSDFLLDVRGIPASCGILNARELDITETDAPEIVQHIAARKWSALEVTTGTSLLAAALSSVADLASPPPLIKRSASALQ